MNVPSVFYFNGKLEFYVLKNLYDLHNNANLWRLIGGLVLVAKKFSLYY